MRTLFTKILLWFLFTVALTSSVTWYVSSIFQRSRQPEAGRFTFELREARRAWEMEGATGLNTFLTRLKDASGGGDAALTDANGRDLVSGRDLSKEIHSPPGGRGVPGLLPFIPWFRIETGRGFTTVNQSRDGKYYFVQTFPVR